jgi:RHS repeat-associated protein
VAGKGIKSLMRQHPVSRPKWQRRLAAGVSGLFAWTALLALPAQALAHPSTARPLGVRSLTLGEMQRISGRQGLPTLHPASVDSEPGSTYPWEASAGGVNTGNGNKLTQVPLTGWTALGGMPVSFALAHNSQSTHNGELGQKWTHSFDLYLAGVYNELNDSTDMAAHWGDDLAYKFAQNVDGTYSAPAGIHDTLVKNADGTFTLTKPNQVKYHYNTAGYCDTITGRNANTIAISYLTGNYVSTISDSTGRSIVLNYDASHRIVSVSDPLSHLWSIAYDASNNLSTITYPVLGTTSYTENFGYNGAHDITSYADKRGHSSVFAYNSTDNSLATASDPYANQTSYAYSSTATTVTDANGHAEVYSYASGRLSQTTDAASQSESYVYDSSNNKTQTTDRRGYIWHASFDARGNLLTSTDPYTNVVTTRTYNAHNFPLTDTDALGNQVVTTFDIHDNPTQVQRKNSLGVVLTTDTLSYNADGTLASKTDGLLHTVSFGYSANGDVTSVTDGNGHTSTVTVNALGWKTGGSDALSHSSSITLDAWGRATSVTTPAGTTTAVYDPNGNAVSTTDANSHTNTATFDFDDRPLVLTKANGDVVSYSYDATGKKGLLSSKTDGNAHTTYYSFTSRNQPSNTTYPDSTTESWTYNNDGSVATHVDGNAATVSYGYDHRGMLTSVGFPAGVGISYTFDVAGQKTAMTDATGSTSYTPDGAGRITSVTTPNGTVGYAYDAANRRTSMSVTGTGSWTYSYDSGDRLTQVVNPSSETASFSYDNANRQTGQTSGNGSTVTTTFDNANRQTEVLHKNSTGATLADYQYAYDGAGNVTTRTDSDGTMTSFGYDPSDQLNSEVRDNSHSTGYSLGYSYDHNANRLTKVVGTGSSAVTTTNTYGAHDQLLTSGSKSYGYDSNGNCTSVTAGTSVTQVAYDYQNRVTGITYPSAATNSFSYNGNDLRMQKVDSAGTANYLCDGTTPASAVLKDGSAVYTPGLSERRGTTSKFYHADALGSTRGITNASQAVTDSVLYDGFGMTVSRTGTTPTPFGFVGKGQYQTDNDSGLMLLGHRYYDASVGRFISSDPAKAGDNWYAYCDNNPLSRIDPSGLLWLPQGIKALLALLEAIVSIPGGNATRTPPSFGQQPPSVTSAARAAVAADDPPIAPPPSPEPPPPPRTPGIGEAFGAGGGDPEGAVGPPGSRPGTPLGGWGGRSGGSGGGAGAPVTIGVGAAAAADGLKVILPIRQTTEQALDSVNDGSPAGDPPDHVGWDPNRRLRGGLFGRN